MSEVLAIGPLNQCGQAYSWADSLQTHSKHSGFSFAPGGRMARSLPGAKLQDRAHKSVPHPRLSPAWYRNNRIGRVLEQSTRLLLESFVAMPAGVVADGVIAHGSEIRNPDTHLDRMEHSYFRLASDEWVERLRQISGINRARAADCPLFVSTPDLLIDAPQATWLPLTLDVENWSCPTPAFSRAEITVLHVPSRREPPIKGTQFIEPVLQAYAKHGRIRYLSPEGVSHEKMRDLVWEADIVVDQIMTGSYGVAAVEAMAAGRLVIGDIESDVRALVGSDIPIIDANPTNFGDVIEHALSSRGRSGSLAREGIEYAGFWHDGRQAARVLSEFLNG